MSQTQEVKVGDHIKTLIAVNKAGEFHFEKGDLFTVFELFHDSLPGFIRITDFEDQAENVWLEPDEYEVAGMSQERTEKGKPSFHEMLAEKAETYHGKHLLRIAIDQLDEIDRLNATISDLTAKVQERDKLINEHAADSYAASEACQSMAEQIERLTAENTSLTVKLQVAQNAGSENAEVLSKEIERLRATIEKASSKCSFASAVAVLEEALKERNDL